MYTRTQHTPTKASSPCHKKHMSNDTTQKDEDDGDDAHYHHRLIRFRRDPDYANFFAQVVDHPDCNRTPKELCVMMAELGRPHNTECMRLLQPYRNNPAVKWMLAANLPPTTDDPDDPLYPPKLILALCRRAEADHNKEDSDFLKELMSDRRP